MSKEQFISHVPRKNTLIYLTTAQFACVFVSPDSAWMPTIWITYHAPVEEELMENLSLWHLHIHKTRQPAASALTVRDLIIYLFLLVSSL